MAVALHLPRLAELPGARGDAGQFLKKLASLARLAISAGVQKKKFLRRKLQEENRTASLLGRTFLLDRARLLVVPVGLETAVRALAGQGLCDGKAGLDLGKQVVQRLHQVLRDDGRAAVLDTCLDGPSDIALNGLQPGTEPAGLTAWDAAAPPRKQLRAASVLHHAAQSGTAALLLPRDRIPGPEELFDLLRFAWKQTSVQRLRIVTAGPSEPMNLTGWEPDAPARV
jgi:hypothetical protein